MCAAWYWYFSWQNGSILSVLSVRVCLCVSFLHRKKVQISKDIIKKKMFLAYELRNLIMEQVKHL